MRQSGCLGQLLEVAGTVIFIRVCSYRCDSVQKLSAQAPKTLSLAELWSGCHHARSFETPMGGSWLGTIPVSSRLGGTAQKCADTGLDPSCPEP